MTRERITEIHTAMEMSAGDRGMAAIKLGITPRELKDNIRSSKELRSRWWGLKQVRVADSVTQPVTQIQELMKDPAVDIPQVPSADKAVAMQLAKEDILVTGGMQNLGLTEIEVDLAGNLCEFYGQHFVSSIGIMGGGVVRTSIKIITELDMIQARLADVRKLLIGDGATQDPILRTGARIEEASLLESYTDLARVLSEMYDRGHKAMMVHAMVKKHLTEPKKQQKPGEGYGRSRESGADLGADQPAAQVGS